MTPLNPTTSLSMTDVEPSQNPGGAATTLGTPQKHDSGDTESLYGHPETDLEPSADLETAIRKARAAQASVTKLQRSHATEFRIGDQVRTNTPRSARFHNRTGTVVTTNLGEVGVSFNANDGTDAWFLPTEITKIRAQGGQPA